MLNNKLNKSFNIIKKILNNDVTNTKQWVSKLVLIILLSWWFSIPTKTQANVNFKDENIYSNNTKKIKLNKAVKYSAMYEKIWLNYKKIYTISPSDKPVFTWNISIIGWKTYAEIILINDKNITWYVSINSFDEESKGIIKKYSNNLIQKTLSESVSSIIKKQNQPIIQENNIEKKDKVQSENDKYNYLNEHIENTINYASSKNNSIRIENIKSLELLENKLNNTRKLIVRLNNEDNARIILNHRINLLQINKNKINPNLSMSELFDYYCTQERLNHTKIYFSQIEFNELYEKYISKDYNWEWDRWFKNISNKLWIKTNIIEYNQEVKIKLEKLRIQWIEKLKEFIANLESWWNYNAIFSNFNQSKIDYTKMTIREVLKDMKKRGRTKWSSATWKYQFMHDTLNELSKNLKIDIDKQLFSKEFQEKIANIKLKQRWLNDFINWEIKRDTFQENLSMEWAALPKNKTGKSFHEDDWINKAFCSNDSLDKALDNIKNPKPESQLLVSNI